MLYYNPENVVEGTKDIENLTCPICYDILKNPIIAIKPKNHILFVKNALIKV